MPVKIISILPESLAAENGLKESDVIISINGHPINDFLDLQFYSADEFLSIKYKNKGNILKNISINHNWEKPVGIETTIPQCRKCINHCIFCFIDQMPANLRDSLYLKDDDYRFSFVFGNFITLTNFSKKDFDRVIEQRLIPLYISIHTTNSDLHKKMLRYKMDFNVLKKLRFLSINGISFHTQIVVVPGWNDGKELERTLADLSSETLNVLSIGIVPVGLTKYRNALTEIRRLNSIEAKEILQLSEKYSVCYCSDEIYLLANEEIPSDNFYNNYPQLENGIGMIRMLLENWKVNKKDFITEISKIKRKIVFVTGTLAFQTIKLISSEINLLLQNKVRVISITNNFFGEMVTVCGLITAQDIFSQLDLKENEIAAFSSNIFNQDRITIDNVEINDFRKRLNNRFLLIDEEFAKWEWF